MSFSVRALSHPRRERCPRNRHTALPQLQAHNWGHRAPQTVPRDAHRLAGRWGGAGDAEAIGPTNPSRRRWNPRMQPADPSAARPNWSAGVDLPFYTQQTFSALRWAENRSPRPPLQTGEGGSETPPPVTLNPALDPPWAHLEPKLLVFFLFFVFFENWPKFIDLSHFCPKQADYPPAPPPSGEGEVAF